MLKGHSIAPLNFSWQYFLKHLHFCKAELYLRPVLQAFAVPKRNVTVAQLDRALDYGSRGLGFDSLR